MSIRSQKSASIQPRTSPPCVPPRFENLNKICHSPSFAACLYTCLPILSNANNQNMEFAYTYIHVHSDLQRSAPRRCGPRPAGDERNVEEAAVGRAARHLEKSMDHRQAPTPKCRTPTYAIKPLVFISTEKYVKRP